MDLESVIFDYARAWVMLHAKTLDGWMRAQIMDAFYMLPSPPVTLERWAMARGVISPQEKAESPQAPARESTPGVVEGPGYCIADGPDAERIIEEKIQRIAARAKEMGNA